MSVMRWVMASILLRREPGGDRLDLVVGESLGDAVHDRRRAACRRGNRAIASDDLRGVAPTQPRRPASRRRRVAGWQPLRAAAPGGASAAWTRPR